MTAYAQDMDKQWPTRAQRSGFSLAVWRWFVSASLNVGSRMNRRWVGLSAYRASYTQFI